MDKEKVKQALGVEDDLSERQILSLIETLVAENNRLEDIEDQKVQIEYQNVFNKGVKLVEDRIRAKIGELETEYEANVGREYSKTKEIILQLNTLQSLLEKGDGNNGI